HRSQPRHREEPPAPCADELRRADRALPELSTTRSPGARDRRGATAEGRSPLVLCAVSLTSGPPAPSPDPRPLLRIPRLETDLQSQFRVALQPLEGEIGVPLVSGLVVVLPAVL